jgi:hypothetical protein
VIRKLLIILIQGRIRLLNTLAKGAVFAVRLVQDLVLPGWQDLDIQDKNIWK